MGEDLDRQALLLERLGAPMYDIVADPVSRHNLLCEVAVRLWRPIGPDIDLPTGAKLAEQYADRLLRLWEQGGRPCSPATVADALDCMNRRRLAHDDRSAVLVHGDIHEMNALQYWLSALRRSAAGRSGSPHGVVTGSCSSPNLQSRQAIVSLVEATARRLA